MATQQRKTQPAFLGSLKSPVTVVWASTGRGGYAKDKNKKVHICVHATKTQIDQLMSQVSEMVKTAKQNIKNINEPIVEEIDELEASLAEVTEEFEREEIQAQIDELKSSLMKFKGFKRAYTRPRDGERKKPLKTEDGEDLFELTFKQNSVEQQLKTDSKYKFYVTHFVYNEETETFAKKIGVDEKPTPLGTRGGEGVIIKFNALVEKHPTLPYFVLSLSRLTQVYHIIPSANSNDDTVDASVMNNIFGTTELKIEDDIVEDKKPTEDGDDDDKPARKSKRQREEYEDEEPRRPKRKSKRPPVEDDDDEEDNPYY